MNPLVNAIARALDGLRYGSVEITVHDGRVTLIERREKLRVPDHEDVPEGTGSYKGGAGPIGRPKDARPREVNPIEEDPTGRPEVPLTERADHATRNLDESSWSDVDPDDGHGGPARDGGRPRSPGAGGPSRAASRRGGAGA